MSDHAAFVLLTLANATLTTATASESGTLSVHCVTLTAPEAGPTIAASLSATDRSVYLVLTLNALELPLDPTGRISLHIAQDGTRIYAFHAPGSSGTDSSAARLNLGGPSTPAHAEDVEMFDHILTQYADLSWETDTPQAASLPERAPDADLRGRLVLMDEASGEVVAELPHRLPITEDPALAQEDTKAAEAGAAKQIAAPVVLELPPDVYDAYTGAAPGVPSDLAEAQEIFVRAVPVEEQDWIMKSALFISQAIMSSTSLLVGGITAASDYYIRHSTPSPSPAPASSSANPSEPAAPPRMLVLLSSPQAHSTLSRAYAISGQAVRVSQYTMGIVEGMIRRAVGGSDSGQQTPSRAGATSPRPPPYTSTTSLAATAAGSKPALPPRRSPAPTPDSSGEKSAHPSRISSPGPSSETAASSHRTVGTMGKVVLSANLLLATVDDSARRVLDVGSERFGAVVNHKYGPAAAHSTNLATHTARNVVLVYIDMRGFARRALITKAGKEWIKSRVGNNKNGEGGSQGDTKT